MFIILEGCDGSGKSTLAQTLCDRYDLKYHHEGPPPRNITPLEHYGSVLESYRWLLQGNAINGVVFDRLALGERVYGPIYRSEDRLNAVDWQIFRRLLMAAGAMHIMCRPDFTVCVQNWENRQKTEMIRDRETLRRIYDGYEALKFEAGPFIEYDYTNPHDLTMVEDYLAGWFGGLMRTLPPGINGSPLARYMFVGDRGARSGSWISDLAFFGMVKSSGYLNCAISDAGFKEEEIAFVNSRRHDGKNLDWPVVDVFIALGNNARAECRARHLRFEHLPHPQHWKRFHAHEYDKYVDMLRKIRSKYEPA